MATDQLRNDPNLLSASFLVLPTAFGDTGLLSPAEVFLPALRVPAAHYSSGSRNLLGNLNFYFILRKWEYLYAENELYSLFFPFLSFLSCPASAT